MWIWNWRGIFCTVVEGPNYVRKRRIYESQKQFIFVIAREAWKSENKRYQVHLRHSYACNFTRPFTGFLAAAYHIKASCHVLCKFQLWSLFHNSLLLLCWLFFQCSAFPVSHTFLIMNLSARYCHALSISKRSHQEMPSVLWGLVSCCFRFSVHQSMAWRCLMNAGWIWSTLSCYELQMHSRADLHINRSHSTRIHVNSSWAASFSESQVRC